MPSTTKRCGAGACLRGAHIRVQPALAVALRRALLAGAQRQECRLLEPARQTCGGATLHSKLRLEPVPSDRPSAPVPASQPPIPRYNDEEYKSLIKKEAGWSREETDYLLELAERYELRFVIIADRYEVRAGGRAEKRKRKKAKRKRKGKGKGKEKEKEKEKKAKLGLQRASQAVDCRRQRACS